MPKFQGGGGSIAIWGCIAGSSTGLAHLYNDWLNQHRYREILEDCLQPSMDVFEADSTRQFQQDNAPCHTARSIKQYMEEKRLKLMSWPAHSPDLNPIENLWSWMDCKLQKSKPTNLVQLKTQMQALWNTVSQDLIKKLIGSMPRRVLACLKNKGGHVKY